MKCEFCGNANISPRKTGCFRWDDCEDTLAESDYMEIIKQASLLGCVQIAFIGGEPTICFDLLIKLTLYALEVGISNFVIYTNGVEINAAQAKFLMKHKYIINMQILTFNSDTGMKITKLNSYVGKITESIRLFNSYPLYFTVLVGNFNEHDFLDIKEKLYLLNQHANVLIEYIYPNNNEYASSQLLHAVLNPNRSFCSINVNKFSNNKKEHSCFSNSIAVASNGDILPCILMRKKILGNIKIDLIAQVLKSEEYLFYKYLTKDKIDPCNKCSFRYGCNDCRAIETDIKTTTNCSTANEIDKKTLQKAEKFNELH